MHSIGERIRAVRQSQNRSLAEVAGRANISVATLSRIENDKQSIEMGLFLLLASVLDAPATELLGVETADGDAEGLHPLVRRIASMSTRERLDLWRALTTERRSQRTGSKVQPGRKKELTRYVEELVAQIDFVRAEVEGLRKRLKLR